MIRLWSSTSDPPRPAPLTVAILVSLSVVSLSFFGCTGATEERQTAAARDPEKARIRDFWQLHGEANRLRLAGDYQAAVERYGQCLELDPGHEDSLYYLGATLKELGQYREAEAVYRRMFEGNPASSRAVSQLAGLLSQRVPGAAPNPDEARSWLERGIALNREHSGPYLKLGRLLLDEGRFADAADTFLTAARFGSPEGSLMSAYALLLQGENRQARRLLQRVLDNEEMETRLAARGGKLEGDTRGATNSPGRPQRSTGIRARLFLSWITPSAAGHDSAPEAPAWHDISKEAGLQPGGGRAAWADFSGDGLVDAVVTGPGPVRLYRNQGGRFVDVTERSGLREVTDTWDACWGDYDSDGDADLYLIRPGLFGKHHNQLWRNDGLGVFTDVTAQMGLDGVRSTARASFADLDGDRRLDLIEAGAALDGVPPLRVFHNRGQSFTEVSRGWGLSVSSAVADFALSDYDADGRLDLFVAPWRSNVKLYRNSSPGSFVETTEQAGLAGVRGLGFSALFFDFDRDGRSDLLLTAHAALGNVIAAQDAAAAENPRKLSARLFRNLPNPRFEETHIPGLHAPLGTIQAVAADIDADGWTDLIFANGGLGAQRLDPSVVLLNRGGEEFHARSWLSGPRRPAPAIGVSVIDIEGDGQPEIYLAGNPLLRQSPFAAGLLLRRRLGARLGTGRCEKFLGQPTAANGITDKQGLRNGRLWQSPIFSHLPVGDINQQTLKAAGN